MSNESTSSPLLTTLGVIAIAFGIGMAGAYVFDWHGHRCDQCGTTWNHLGAFSAGEPDKHTCPKCGAMQWWKDGVPRHVRDVHDHIAFLRGG
jgi:rRNA maturation endonuclease Nob1